MLLPCVCFDLILFFRDAISFDSLFVLGFSYVNALDPLDVGFVRGDLGRASC